MTVPGIVCVKFGLPPNLRDKLALALEQEAALARSAIDRVAQHPATKVRHSGPSRGSFRGGLTATMEMQRCWRKIRNAASLYLHEVT